MKKIVMLLASLILVLAACSVSPSKLQLDTSNSIIDWVDFVKWNGGTYEANNEVNSLEKEWQPADEVGVVTYMLDGHAGINHKTKNGDASYLPKGTKLFAIKGYDPEFRLLADGKVYEASESETAETIGDFLDIEGKVQRVILQSEQDLSFVGAFSDEHAKEFVEELLLTPYEPNYEERKGKRVFFGIELLDGTMTRSLYWPETDEVNYGGKVSEQMKEIFHAEMDAHRY